MNEQIGKDIINIASEHLANIPNLFEYPLTATDISEILNNRVNSPLGIGLAEWIHFRNIYCTMTTNDQYIDITTHKITKSPKGLINKRLQICSSTKDNKKFKVIEEHMKKLQPDDVPMEDLPNPKELEKEIKRILKRLD